MHEPDRKDAKEVAESDNKGKLQKATTAGKEEAKAGGRGGGGAPRKIGSRGANYSLYK